MNNKKIAIIGGGLGGLSLGYYLSKTENKVIIFEKESFLGGLVGGFKMEGENLEKLYHHFFKTDKDLINLLKEIGLEEKIIWNKSSTGLYWKSKMYPFNGAMDLLKFKPLGLMDKFRMGIAALYLGFDNNWQKYKDKTAVEWVKKWMGKKGYEVVWKPLLQGKFHKYYEDISMAWLWARIHTRGNSKNEKGEEVLGYIDGGFEILVERLEELIKKNNGEIKLNSEVKNIKKLESDFDLIIDTRPLKEIEYIGAVTLVFSTDQNLSKYYWHNINDLDSPFVAFIQHTNLVDKSKYNNKHIYYLGTYIPQDHRYFKLSDQEIEKEFLNFLTKMFKNFDSSKIHEKKIFKYKYAQHIVDTEYKLPNYKVGKKIYKLNFSQIYPQDRGINFAVREAEKILETFKNQGVF